jgi:hypothetical protein
MSGIQPSLLSWERLNTFEAEHKTAFRLSLGGAGLIGAALLVIGILALIAQQHNLGPFTALNVIPPPAAITMIVVGGVILLPTILFTLRHFLLPHREGDSMDENRLFSGLVGGGTGGSGASDGRTVIVERQERRDDDGYATVSDADEASFGGFGGPDDPWEPLDDDAPLHDTF